MAGVGAETGDETVGGAVTGGKVVAGGIGVTALVSSSGVGFAMIGAGVITGSGAKGGEVGGVVTGAAGGGQLNIWLAISPATSFGDSGFAICCWDPVETSVISTVTL